MFPSDSSCLNIDVQSGISRNMRTMILPNWLIILQLFRCDFCAAYQISLVMIVEGLSRAACRW